MESSPDLHQVPTHYMNPLHAIGITVAASVILGGLTSFAQTFLPAALTMFANSSSGWTILTAVIVWFVRSRTALSALLGALSFVGLVMGYAWISLLRDFYYSPLLFGAVGVVVGPFVGVAASWLRRIEWRAAAGSSLLAGICVGDAIYGLTVVSGTTSPVYWILAGVLGIVLLVGTVIRRVTKPWLKLLAFLAAGAVATAYLLVYTSFGTA